MKALQLLVISLLFGLLPASAQSVYISDIGANPVVELQTTDGFPALATYGLRNVLNEPITSVAVRAYLFSRDWEYKGYYSHVVEDEIEAKNSLYLARNVGAQPEDQVVLVVTAVMSKTHAWQIDQEPTPEDVMGAAYLGGSWFLEKDGGSQAACEAYCSNMLFKCVEACGNCAEVNFSCACGHDGTKNFQCQCGGCRPPK